MGNWNINTQNKDEEKIYIAFKIKESRRLEFRGQICMQNQE